MSKHHLRKDNICENCGLTVAERFCTHCGQENVETRQTFGHLVRHFMEDLTHYESNVWKTVKYLLFRPAYLTKSYLSGKRMTYVPPVKLYIFISFIAFFLPGILPDLNKTHKDKDIIHNTRITSDGLEAEPNADELNATPKATPVINGYSTERQYDSVQNNLPELLKDHGIKRFFSKKLLRVNGLSEEEKKEKIRERMFHNFPKVLFLYLPLFAFIVWLFHGKKRWFYFDHAIFTLHYFSFILLMTTIFNILGALIPWHFIIDEISLSFIIYPAVFIWAAYYFYRGHRKLYNEKRAVSAFKSTVILFINTSLFLIFLFAFAMFTLFTV